jgi:proline dehydrogenase
MAGDLYGTASRKRVYAVYGALVHSSHAHATVQSQVLAVHVSGILVKKGLKK